MPTGHHLTDRQRQTLDFVRDFVAEMGYSPTFAEIGVWLGISLQGAAKQVHTLVDLGALTITPGVCRSVRAK